MVVGPGTLSVPYVVLFTAGLIWLFQHNLIWQWLALSGVATLAGWGLARGCGKRTRRAGRFLRLRSRPCPIRAGKLGKRWRRLPAGAGPGLALGPAPAALAVLREVLDAVAGQYHPASKRPALEIPVPDVLRIVELVARDLRQAWASRCRGPTSSRCTTSAACTGWPPGAKALFPLQGGDLRRPSRWPACCGKCATPPAAGWRTTRVAS